MASIFAPLQKLQWDQGRHHLFIWQSSPMFHNCLPFSSVINAKGLNQCNGKLSLVWFWVQHLSNSWHFENCRNLIRLSISKQCTSSLLSMVYHDFHVSNIKNIRKISPSKKTTTAKELCTIKLTCEDVRFSQLHWNRKDAVLFFSQKHMCSPITLIQIATVEADFRNSDKKPLLLWSCW